MAIDISKLLQLKQLPFNANNDNLIRVLCELMQEVVDTTNALTGELISDVALVRDSNDNVCIQLTKENDETIQSPAYGIEMWETLDLSNLPNNFASGQELMITFLTNASEYNATGWTTAPTTLPTETNQTTIHPTVRFKLVSDTKQGTMMTAIQASTTAVNYVEVMVEDVGYWNNSNENTTFMQMYPTVFNGGGLQAGTGIMINRSNVTSYIESIKRKL